MKYNFKCFNKINGKVSEWVKFFKEFNAMPVNQQIKFGNIDCWVCEADSETEKAWVFNYTKLYEQGDSYKRFYYAPKSQCKVLENDYYIDEDTKAFHKGTFVLVPSWIHCHFGY